MGKTSRTKGREFQSRIARWLRETLGLGNYQSTQGIENSQRGNIGDVRLDEDGTPAQTGLLVQAKKGARPSVWRAMRQAEEAVGDRDTLMPVAVVHRDQKKPGDGAEQLVCLRPEDFGMILLCLYGQDPGGLHAATEGLEL